MAKFYGAVGYGETKETVPGVWQEEITERKYTGDFVRNASKWQNGENLNSNLVLDKRLSIVADPFAYQNCHLIRYVCWMGVKWLVTSIDIERPRLILTIGGVYNDQTSGTSRDPDENSGID